MTTVEPRGIERQNLGGAFQTRAAGAGKLQPKAKRSQETVVDVRESPATAEESVKEPAAPAKPHQRTEAPPKETPAPKAAKAAKAAKAQKAAAPAKQQIIVYLPANLADRLRAAGEQTGRTHLQLVTDALDATHERLDELLASAGYVEAQSSSLFGKTARPVARRPGRRGSNQVSLRPPADVRDVMDRLVEKHSAPNRSVLIEVALDAHLPR